jgi:hypothetical protein
MSFVERLMQYVYPKILFEKNPASIQRLEPMHFSGRRAALLFIAMLPVSHRANRWGWWDAFMPENPRRRMLQKDF